MRANILFSEEWDGITEIVNFDKTNSNSTHDGISSITIYVTSSTLHKYDLHCSISMCVGSFFGYFNFQDQMTKPIFYTYAQISKQDILRFYIPM